MLNYFKNGLSLIAQNKRLVLLFFAINFLFAAIVMFPFRMIFSQFYGGSMLIENGLTVDALIDFGYDMPLVLQAFMVTVVFFAIIYWTTNLFLSGGALAQFLNRKSYDKAFIWGQSGRYFWKSVRLLLWCVLPGLVLFLVLPLIVDKIQSAMYGNDPYESIAHQFNVVKMWLRFVSWLICWMIFDYSRLHLIRTDERWTWKSFAKGFVFTFRHIHRTFTVAALLFLLGSGVFFMTNKITGLFEGSGIFQVTILFIIHQVYMAWRMFLRLTLFASEAELYNERISVVAQKQASAKAPALEPAIIPSL